MEFAGGLSVGGERKELKDDPRVLACASGLCILSVQTRGVSAHEAGRGPSGMVFGAGWV